MMNTDRGAPAKTWARDPARHGGCKQRPAIAAARFRVFTFSPARVAAGVLVLGALAAPAAATADDSLSWSRVARVLLLQDYNTRVVVVGVALLGIAAGLIGCFMLLRERALLGDALSHATLPGIGLAVIAMVALGETGKSLAGLLVGATVSGVLGVLAILVVVHWTRIKEDTALGVVLSVFFGLGVAIMGLIQNMGEGHAAGLQAFIYGKTASMLLADAVMIGVAALLSAGVCLVLFKEFTLLCFDPGFARAQGWPVLALDIVMMAVVVMVTVVGLQAVGLILMIALLVIPPAAARFWTHHLPTMLAVSGAIGAVSGLLGAAASALAPRLPAGAIIVVVAGVLFGVSLLCGPARGVLARLMTQRRLARKVARQNLLRALHESTERGPATVPFESLLAARSWSPRQLRAELAAAQRAGLVRCTGGQYALTEPGAGVARRVTRNHRLWELYLITHADIAPSHVDRDADQVEHALEPALIEQLEALLADRHPELASPHVLDVRNRE